MNPDLKEFDLILLNTSGGKDSQTLLDVVTRQARELDILDRCHAVHAILEEEWDGTLDLVKEQVAHYGIPLHLVKRPQGSLLDQVRARKMWPSSTARYCTSDHKRGQVSKVITELVAAHPSHRPRVLNCLGLRAAESSARSKKVAYQLDQRHTNSRREVWAWLPIFDLSLDQVWEIIRESGVRSHWVYAAGMPRVSCCFCIFAPRAALIRAGQLNPELLERYVQVEREINHTFRKDLSLVSIQQAVNAGEQPGKVCTWEM